MEGSGSVGRGLDWRVASSRLSAVTCDVSLSKTHYPLRSTGSTHDAVNCPEND